MKYIVTYWAPPGRMFEARLTAPDAAAAKARPGPATLPAGQWSAIEVRPDDGAKLRRAPCDVTRYRGA